MRTPYPVSTTNWKKEFPLLLITYLALAIPTVLSIWHNTLETHMDTYGRAVLSVIILGIICPLFSLNSLLLFHRIVNGLKERSFCEFVYPTHYTWPDLYKIHIAPEDVSLNSPGRILHAAALCASVLLTVILPLFYLPKLMMWFVG